MQFQPGASIFEQTVYAAKRAMIAGQMRAGDAFPSVRALSRELKINPNTAHKVVTALIAEGMLEAQPGIGTVVARLPDSSRRERTALLGQQVEELIVQAKRVGVKLEALQEAVTQHWNRLSVNAPQQDVQDFSRALRMFRQTNRHVLPMRRPHDDRNDLRKFRLTFSIIEPKSFRYPEQPADHRRLPLNEGPMALH